MLETKNTAVITKNNVHLIVKRAKEVAQKAAKETNASMPPENQRGLDCGFAWVVIKPARGILVNYLKMQGIGNTRTYGGGGLEVWYSRIHNEPTQSIDVHIAACRAFADVLKSFGVNADWGSRLD